MRKQGKHKKGKKGGNGQFGAPGRLLGAITDWWRPRHALGRHLGAIGARGRHLGATLQPKNQLREFRVSTPYISFLTPSKPLPKPHLHENKVAMLGFTQNLSNPLIPLPFP